MLLGTKHMNSDTSPRPATHIQLLLIGVVGNQLAAPGPAAGASSQVVCCLVDVEVAGAGSDVGHAEGVVVVGGHACYNNVEIEKYKRTCQHVLV